MDIYFNNTQGILEKLDTDIVTALTSPVHQGEFHLKDPNTDPIKQGDQVFPGDFPLFASNYGLVHGSSGMTVLSYEGKNYKIIQLTDEPIMLETDDHVSLCPLKLLGGGGLLHLIQTTPDEIMQALSNAGYVPKEIQSLDRLKLSVQLKAEVPKNITPTLIEELRNRHHYLGKIELGEAEKEIRDILKFPSVH